MNALSSLKLVTTEKVSSNRILYFPGSIFPVENVRVVLIVWVSFSLCFLFFQILEFNKQSLKKFIYCCKYQCTSLVIPIYF